MRKCFAILAMAVLLATGAGISCTKKSSNNFVSPENGFSINLPKDWEVKKGFMGTVVATMSPQMGPEDSFRENINIIVTDAEGAADLKAYADATFESSKSLLTDYQLFERGNTHHGDSHSEWAIFSHRQGDSTLKTMTHLLVNKGKTVIITSSGTPESFDAYRPQFEEIVKTFKFE